MGLVALRYQVLGETQVVAALGALRPPLPWADYMAGEPQAIVAERTLVETELSASSGPAVPVHSHQLALGFLNFVRGKNGFFYSS